MNTRTTFESNSKTGGQARSIPRLRLAFDAVYWHAAFLVFTLNEFLLWGHITQRAPAAPVHRKLLYFLHRTPRMFVRGMFIAAIACVIIDLVLRYVVSPPADRWRNPRSIDPDLLSFHLEYGEKVEGSTAGRRRTGPRRWVSGLLVLTDRYLRFLPGRWDQEPLSIRRRDILELGLQAPPAFAGRLIVGVPDRLIALPREGDAEAFIAGDLDRVKGWSIAAAKPAKPALGSLDTD